jgi:divalent metal cation (Fe/Co/Zn/Cd) transporter
VRSVGRRLLDGVEPELVDRAEHALEHVDGIERVDRLRLRWVGHRLQGDALVVARADADPGTVAVAAESSVRDHLRNVDDFIVTVRPGD